MAVHQYYLPVLGHIGTPQIPGPPEDHPSELIHSSTLLRVLNGSGIKNASLSLPACSSHPVTEAAAHELSLFSTLSVKPRSLPQRRAGSRLAHCCSCFLATLMQTCVVSKLHPWLWSFVAHPLSPGAAASCQFLSVSMDLPILNISYKENHTVFGHLQLAYFT